MNTIPFHDLPDTDTPVSAGNLNLLQSNIETELNNITSSISTSIDNFESNVIGDLANLTTSDKSKIVNAINELDLSKATTDVATTINNGLMSNLDKSKLDEIHNYSISNSGDWVIKEYDDGYVDMYYKKTKNVSVTTAYGTGGYWGSFADPLLPIQLSDIYSINISIQNPQHLTFATSQNITSNNSILIYIWDGMSGTYNLTLYMHIFGKKAQEVNE
jgi:hypothetical protein